MSSKINHSKISHSKKSATTKSKTQPPKKSQQKAKSDDSNKFQLNIPEEFHKILNEFLGEMAGVFDDCENCNNLFETHSGFMKGLPVAFVADEAKKRILSEWHQQLHPYYDACKNKNPLPLFECNFSILAKINFRQKWHEICEDPTSVDNIWEYINQLNRLATIHHSIPAGILTKVTSLVEGPIGNVLAGKGSIADIKIEEIADTITKDITEEDIGCLVNNIQSLLSVVDMNELSNNELGIKLPENMSSPLEMISSMMGGGASSNQNSQQNKQQKTKRVVKKSNPKRN